MMQLLNHAFTAPLFSIGHQTGLFDTMATLPPSTSEAIARAAGLDERYVREWLGAMVTSRVVEYDPAAGTYRLPPEHAAFLTRAAGPDNMAFFTQYIALVGEIEQKVTDCFRNGGGVPYSAYPGFQRLQAEESARVFDAALIQVILPLVDGLVERLEQGIDALDIGCGQGHATNLMARAFPQSRFAAYDISEEGIAAGREEARQWGLRNARFEVKDVATLNEPGRYGLITAFDTVHDQAQPRKVLRNVFEALRPGGVFLMGDIAASSRLEENLDHPLGPFLYAVSVLHCMTVSLAAGGEGLGTAWGEQRARELLAEAGFTRVEVKQIEGDIFNNYYVARK
ncbi:MAG TPA: class I SAM-dependent methyltransferase [Dehalococcoidia bacterium]|nr:class I SAM-dependent methyltransferase [Dehalococcoidia bacterium]